MSVEIRRARPEEWERVRALRLAALHDEPDAFASTHAHEAAQPPEFWRERLARDDAATFVASRDRADIGMAVGAALRDADGVAGLFGMWVAGGARGTGVADSLVRAVIAWARERSFTRVRLEVADANSRAIACYARLGFAPTGRTGALPPPRAHLREHERELAL